MMTIFTVLFYIWLGLLAVGLIMIGVGRYYQWRLKLAIKRNAQAEWNLAEARSRLAATQEVLSYNMVPTLPPATLRLCCPKNDPCDRHRPQ